MSDELKDENTEQDQQKSQEDAGQEKPESKTETKPEDELPQWAKDKIAELNREAAGYRVKHKEVKEALEKAKSVEEFEAVRNDFAAQVAKLEREVMVRDVAAEVDLPKELWDRLRGDTKEALLEDAKSLKKFVQPPAEKQRENPRGGLDPKPRSSDGADWDDPNALAAALKSKGQFVRRR